MTAWANACGADPAGDNAMFIPARELLDVGTGLRVQRLVGVFLHCDRRNRDDRRLSEQFF
jgi:hypothetical protein